MQCYNICEWIASSTIVLHVLIYLITRSRDSVRRILLLITESELVFQEHCSQRYAVSICYITLEFCFYFFYFFFTISTVQRRNYSCTIKYYGSRYILHMLQFIMQIHKFFVVAYTFCEGWCALIGCFGVCCRTYVQPLREMFACSERGDTQIGHRWTA